MQRASAASSVLFTLERLCTVAVRVANTTKHKRHIFRPDGHADILPYTSKALKQQRRRRQQQQLNNTPSSSSLASAHPGLRTYSLHPCRPTTTTVPLPSIRNLKYNHLRKEPLMWKQRLGPAGGRFWVVFGFFFHMVIQRSGDGDILRCRLHPAFCSPTRGARWGRGWGRGGGCCGPSSPVCVTLSLIHHHHTRRRIYLIYFPT